MLLVPRTMSEPTPDPSVYAAAQAGLLRHYLNDGFASPVELFRFIQAFWGIKMPRAPVCPGHSSPAEYVAAAFFEEVQDCICWANRGGGKTLSGALVTWLDAVFRPGCETKILGGSAEQALQMYGHIKGKLITPAFQDLLEGEALRTRTHLVNSSNIQILTASMKICPGPPPPEAQAGRGG